MIALSQTDEPKTKWPSRAAPIDNFERRGLRIDPDGRWFCAVEGCPKSTEPFPDARSAKSHPWPAHKIRSTFNGSTKRRDRRYRSAPIASELIMAHVDGFLGGLSIKDSTRNHLRRVILEKLSVPADAPPPPLSQALASIPAPVKWREPVGPDRRISPGDAEELRRRALYLVHRFSIDRQWHPALVVTELGAICDRRFYRVGGAALESDDAYGGRTKASLQLERVAELFTVGAKR